MLSGGVLDEVDVEVGDQSNSTVALAGTAHLYPVLTVTMSLALCHLNIVRIRRTKEVENEAGFLKSDIQEDIDVEAVAAWSYMYLKR